MRRPKTNRVPRTRAGGQWTEAAFWGFIRSNLRLMSRKWPPLLHALKLDRRPYTGPNKRQKWEVRCRICGKYYKAGDMEVDHIEPCGRLTCWEDVVPFMQRLLCEPDRLRVLCKACHRTVTSTNERSE